MRTGTDREPLEREVLAVVGRFAEELGTTPPRGAVDPGDSLDRDLGIGSLERVELCLRLEEAFALRLPDAVLAEASTCADLVRAIRAGAPVVAEAPPEPAAPEAPGRPAPSRATTLVEVLAWRAEVEPERVHLRLREADGAERPLTYGTLWADACRLAAGIRDLGVRPGETVALMLRTEAAFFRAFFGVLLAGAVPVPIYPPFRLDRLEEYAARQTGILRNAEARLLLTFDEAAPVATLLRRRVLSLRAVAVADRLTGASTAAPEPRLAARHPALIQYTSGSTGQPKGVLLSHANVLANLRAIGRTIALRPDDVAVSWLPLYHDMGLIGLWLGALHFGVPLVLMSPLAFLSRPARWLRALHAHRGTISAAPNFAYDLCARRIRDEELAGLDLRAWRIAFNGSEPVSADTIDRFTRRFAAAGFSPEAMCPVYGLAECAVGLTMPPAGRPPRVDRVARAFERTRRADPAAGDEPRPLRIVSCGRPLPDHEVRIVDDAGRPVAERVEGHVHFRGPSVTGGYHRDPAATAAALRDGWMDSGDLGYWAGGELHVTGRQKDLIIKAGRNLHPHVVEEVVGDVAGVRRGCVAAFGVADPEAGTERLVVVAESRETGAGRRAAVEALVRDRVVAALGVPPDAVVLAPPGSVPKTPSGKIRRGAAREAYAAGALGRRRQSGRVQWLRLVAADVARGAGRLGAGSLRLAWAAWVGLVLLVTMPLLWAVVACVSGARADAAVRRWARLVLRVAGCGPDVEGLERLPRAGTAVLAANHASYADALALFAALPCDFRFVGKRELAGWPLVGRVIRAVGHLTVERVDLSRSVADAERVTAALRGGTWLACFPEGTFAREPGLLPFRLGAFKAAVDAGCSVVPLAILGTREVLPAGAWLPRPARVRVRIGAPVRAGGRAWRDIVRLRNEVREAIDVLTMPS